MTTNNSSALSALQALAQAQYKPRKPASPTPLAKQVEKVVIREPYIASVEINLDSKEIAVEIVGRLSEVIENQLFYNGFAFALGSRVWIANYNAETVGYLNSVWNQDIDIPSEPQNVELVANPVPVPLPSVPEDLFERYKRQVDELCDKLKIDRADLLLMAIEHLYQAKLSN